MHSDESLYFSSLHILVRFFLLCVKGSFLIAEVMASKGYKVQPLPRVPRCDTVQVFRSDSILFSCH